MNILRRRLSPRRELRGGRGFAVVKDAPLMGLLDFLTRAKRERLVEQLAGQIAVLSHHAVQQRLAAQVDQMSRAEARGYVRARAAQVIHREVELLLATQPQVPQTARAELVLRATNQVVQRVTHDLFFAQPRRQLQRQAA